MPAETLERALEKLLHELFDADEFRTFLRGLEGGQRLVAALAGKSTSDETLFSEAVYALHRRGEIDDGFFAALAEERPKKAARVREVAAAWSAAASPAAIPPSAPTSAPSTAPATPIGDPVHVFLSYSQDTPAHKTAVRDLADRLRADGIDAWIDQYVTAPPEGWPRWMSDQVERSRYIVLVCTETYKRRFEGRETPGTGKGATWEGLLATQVLYDAGTINQKLIPVLLDGASDTHIPLALKPYTHYRLPAGYDELVRHLTGQPVIVAPPLGKVRVMPPQARGPALPAQPVVSAGLPLAPPAGTQTVINHGPVGQQINIQGGAHTFNLGKGNG